MMIEDQLLAAQGTDEAFSILVQNTKSKLASLSEVSTLDSATCEPLLSFNTENTDIQGLEYLQALIEFHESLSCDIYSNDLFCSSGQPKEQKRDISKSNLLYHLATIIQHANTLFYIAFSKNFCKQSSQESGRTRFSLQIGYNADLRLRNNVSNGSRLAINGGGLMVRDEARVPSNSWCSSFFKTILPKPKTFAYTVTALTFLMTLGVGIAEFKSPSTAEKMMELFYGAYGDKWHEHSLLIFSVLAAHVVGSAAIARSVDACMDAKTRSNYDSIV